MFLRLSSASHENRRLLRGFCRAPACGVRAIYRRFGLRRSRAGRALCDVLPWLILEQEETESENLAPPSSSSVASVPSYSNLLRTAERKRCACVGRRGSAANRSPEDTGHHQHLNRHLGGDKSHALHNPRATPQVPLPSPEIATRLQDQGTNDAQRRTKNVR